MLLLIKCLIFDVVECLYILCFVKYFLDSFFVLGELFSIKLFLFKKGNNVCVILVLLYLLICIKINLYL